ncbi:MAG: VOC family protein [Blastocatellia bacterium]|nr:VOC family protein [Blastocatellia bacterium]
MVETYGLTHISLAVRDIDRSLQFYQQVFGVREYYRDENSIQVISPRGHDVIAFEYDPVNAGESKGINHFGFRLINSADIDKAVEEVERAGGTVIKKGEFAPGCPFAYIHDPDGYMIEIWYE